MSAPPHSNAGCGHCGTPPTPENRRRFAKPPATRGRRGHAVIPQIEGLSEWMEQQFQEVPRPSFREIETRLQKTPFWQKIRAAGFRTGKSSIHTHWVRWFAEIARKRVIADYAARFNETGDEGDILAIETAISGLANVGIFDALQEELSGNGLTEKAQTLIELHRKLQTSSARREAERRQAGVNARGAYETARAEIVAILKKQPDALRLVLAAIDNAQTKSEDSDGSSQRSNERSSSSDRRSKRAPVQSLPKAA